MSFPSERLIVLEHQPEEVLLEEVRRPRRAPGPDVQQVVIVLFMGGLEQRTLPRQMWSGIREEISPTLLAVATFLILFALLALSTVKWLRRRGEGAAKVRS